MTLADFMEQMVSSNVGWDDEIKIQNVNSTLDEPTSFDIDYIEEEDSGTFVLQYNGPEYVEE